MGDFLDKYVNTIVLVGAIIFGIIWYLNAVDEQKTDVYEACLIQNVDKYKTDEALITWCDIVTE